VVEITQILLWSSTFSPNPNPCTFSAGYVQSPYCSKKVNYNNPDGSYLTSLGREGKGAGEFAALTSNTTMEVYANHLYVTDLVDVLNYFPHRMNVFSLEDLSFSHTIKLLAENRNEYEELERHSPKQFYPRDEGTFLVSYHRSPTEYQDEESFIRYVIQDSTGNIASGPILEQKDRTNLVYNYPTGATIIHSFPFHGKRCWIYQRKAICLL